jgi:predicted nucleotidyltransferase
MYQSALVERRIINTKLSTPLSKKDIYPLRSLENAEQILKDRLDKAYEAIKSKFGLEDIHIYLYGSQFSGVRSKTTGEPDIDIIVYHPSFIDGPRIKSEVYMKLRDISLESPFKLDISCQIKSLDGHLSFLRIY